MTHSRSALVILLSVAAVAGGCARIPTTHFYVLELRDQSGNPPNPRDGLTIGVKAFHVDPPYDQDRIVYRIGEASPEVGFYAYHRWAAPLARLVPRVVADGLGPTPGVQVMEPVVPGRDYQAYLTGRLLVLEEIDEPAGQRVRVRIELILRSADGAELWSEALSGEATTQSDQVDAVVAEMSQVLSRAIRDARDGLGRALERH